jgi:hypothetical protein
LNEQTYRDMQFTDGYLGTMVMYLVTTSHDPVSAFRLRKSARDSLASIRGAPVDEGPKTLSCSIRLSGIAFCARKTFRIPVPRI